MTAALVLLDLQNGILFSSAIDWENPNMPSDVVRTAAVMLTAARGAGAPVVHVGVTRPSARGIYDDLRSASAKKSGRAPRDILALAPGSAEIEFALPPVPGEEVVYKFGVSAFAGTRLDMLLRNVGVRDVIVAGAFTHMVVESTARQGFDLGYRMIVAADACCAPAAAPHANSLATGIPNFAMVMQAADAATMFRAS